MRSGLARAIDARGASFCSGRIQLRLASGTLAGLRLNTLLNRGKLTHKKNCPKPKKILA